MVVPVLLIAVVVGGLLVLRGGSGLPGADGDARVAGQEDLPKNPDLTATSFPDLDRLGVDQGVKAFCGNVDKVMRARGYHACSSRRTPTGSPAGTVRPVCRC